MRKIDTNGITSFMLSALKLCPARPALLVLFALAAAPLSIPMAQAKELPTPLFKGSIAEEFGYAVGTRIDGLDPATMFVSQALDRTYAPFTKVSLSVSSPSHTVTSVTGVTEMRSAKACLASLDVLRDQLESAFGLTLEHETFTTTHQYTGYYGSRDAVLRRISCEDQMLSVRVELGGYASGCDPGEAPALPAEGRAETEAALKKRFPEAQLWKGQDVRRASAVIAELAESAYSRALSDSPCLRARVVIYAVIDPAGKAQAVQVLATEGVDAALRQRITDSVQRTSFATTDDPAMRLLNVQLRLDPAR